MYETISKWEHCLRYTKENDGALRISILVYYEEIRDFLYKAYLESYNVISRCFILNKNLYDYN